MEEQHAVIDRGLPVHHIVGEDLTHLHGVQFRLDDGPVERVNHPVDLLQIPMVGIIEIGQAVVVAIFASVLVGIAAHIVVAFHDIAQGRICGHCGEGADPDRFRYDFSAADVSSGCGCDHCGQGLRQEYCHDPFCVDRYHGLQAHLLYKVALPKEKKEEVTDRLCKLEFTDEDRAYYDGVYQHNDSEEIEVLELDPR